jgi:hypothetical protein
MKVCQTSIAVEESAVNDAQQQFNEAKAEYDRFMATNNTVREAVGRIQKTGRL